MNWKVNSLTYIDQTFFYGFCYMTCIYTIICAHVTCSHLCPCLLYVSVSISSKTLCIRIALLLGKLKRNEHNLSRSLLITDHDDDAIMAIIVSSLKTSHLSISPNHGFSLRNHMTCNNWTRIWIRTIVIFMSL